MRLAEWQTRLICQFAGAMGGEEAIKAASKIRLLDDEGELFIPDDEDDLPSQPHAVRIGGGPAMHAERPEQRNQLTVRDTSTQPSRPRNDAPEPAQAPQPGVPLDDPVGITPGVGTGRVTDPEQIAQIEAATERIGETERLAMMFPGMVLGPNGPMPGDAVIMAHPPEDDDPRLRG